MMPGASEPPVIGKTQLCTLFPRHKLTPEDLFSKIIPQSIEMRRGWWSNKGPLSGFPLIAEAALRLLSMHATSCAPERNWSQWGLLYSKMRANLSLDVGEKMIFIKGNSGMGGNAGDDVEVLLDVLS